MVGIMAFLAPIFAAAVAVSTYFGIKSFVKWRKRQIKKAIGQGVCAICGAMITENHCPNCDTTRGN
jgi:rubrerythrin